MHPAPMPPLRMHSLRALLVTAAITSLIACDAGRTRASDAAATGDTDGGYTGPIDPGGPLPATTLRGTVYAPEGTIPISGALIYLTPSPPPPIPDTVYCDTCVKLTEGTPFARSNPDGTFALPVSSASGTQYLVVQKGQFRRIREFTLFGGDQPVPQNFSTLPGRMDKAKGDDIPRMAVVTGRWDAIEVSLAKLGLGKLTSATTVDKKSLSFDLYEDAGFFPDPNAPFSPDKILKDAKTIGKYHIVFLPCQSGLDDNRQCSDYRPGDTAIQKNLRQFVAAGGKLYATDYSYEFVRQTFPGYIDWDGQTGQVGSACLGGEYNAAATVDDPDMSAWLKAQGINAFDVEDNWTLVDGVNPVNTVDLNNKPVTVTPTVWVSGQTRSGLRPSTVSFVAQCGRVLYSTYHTEVKKAGKALLPQEKALLYVLLEVAVCVEPPTIQ